MYYLTESAQQPHEVQSTEGETEAQRGVSGPSKVPQLVRRLAGGPREAFQPQQDTASPQWRRNCCTYRHFWLFSSPLQCEGIVYYILGSWWYGLVFTKKDSRTGPPNTARILTGRDPWHSPQDLMLGKSMTVHSKQKYSYQRGKPHLQVQHTFSKNRGDCGRGAASLAA